MSELELSKASRFVSYILEKCREDSGFAASLRRADNPRTEYQSWGVLAGFGIPLNSDPLRLPYQTVSAAIARVRPAANGTLSLGKAIAHCYQNGNAAAPAEARLRRLLACQNIRELCLILRGQLSLIESRVAESLDYVALLEQLLAFHKDRQHVKEIWAMDFYAKASVPLGDESGVAA